MSIKREIRRFHVVVVQRTSKKCTKMRDARAELLFWSLNLLFFLLFLSRRWGCRRPCIRSLIISNNNIIMMIRIITIINIIILLSFAKLRNKKNSIPAAKCDSYTNVMQIYLPYGSALVINFIIDRIMVFSFLVYKACLRQKADLLMFINQDCYL